MSRIIEEENNTPINTSVPDFSAEITEIIKSNLTPKKMQDKILSYHEKDISLALAQLSDEEIQKLFRLLPMETLVNVLEHTDNITEYFRKLNIRQKVEALSLMETSTAVEVLMQLSKDERTSLTDLISPELRSEINLLRSFDEDEIGSRMSTNYIEIPDTATIKEAMSELVRQAAENDNISILYVVDKDKTFGGAIDLKDLIVARRDMPLSDIITFSYPYLYAKSSIQDCIPVFIDYSEASIPVLDNDNKLIGVVTAQDFMEVIDEEFGEDYARLAGLSAEEDLSEPVSKSVRKRLPWLIILLAFGFGVSATVGLFESIVAQLPIIMCFQSMILDMAGNAGTQSLAVAIRVLMDNQIAGKQKAVLVWKQARIGLLNGICLGVLSFIAIGLYLCLKGNSVEFSFAVSGCLGAAMILAMVISSLSGTVIPMVFEKIGIDPAVASGPLITTVNDLVAVVSYYGLAWLILINAMHLVG